MTPREQLAAYYEQLAAFERSVELRWAIVQAMDDDPAAGNWEAERRIETALANLRPGRSRSPVIDEQPAAASAAASHDVVLAFDLVASLARPPRRRRSDFGKRHHWRPRSQHVQQRLL